MLSSKAVKVSYILVFPQAFFPILDVKSAIDELLSGLRCVFLVCNLSTEEMAGLRWVREGIGRIDLPGESLIQRSHNIGPVRRKQLTACQSHTGISPDSSFCFSCGGWRGSIGFSVRFEENRGQAASFQPPGDK